MIGKEKKRKGKEEMEREREREANWLFFFLGGIDAGSSDFGLGGGWKITPTTLELGKCALTFEPAGAISADDESSCRNGNWN